MDEYENLYKGFDTYTLGKTFADVARILFTALRNADESGMEKIFFHGLDTDKEGLAVMNRIIRAAGHNVTVVAKEENIV